MECNTKRGISFMKYDSVLHHHCSVSLDFGVTFWRLYPYKTYYFRKLEVPTLAWNTLYLINFSCYKFDMIKKIKACSIDIYLIDF